MPFKITPSGGKFIVMKKDGSKRFGTHKTRLGAQRQIAAIHASEAIKK